MLIENLLSNSALLASGVKPSLDNSTIEWATGGGFTAKPVNAGSRALVTFTTNSLRAGDKLICVADLTVAGTGVAANYNPMMTTDSAWKTLGYGYKSQKGYYQTDEVAVPDDGILRVRLIIPEVADGMLTVRGMVLCKKEEYMKIQELSLVTFNDLTNSLFYNGGVGGECRKPSRPARRHARSQWVVAA
ncbi:hypothetical protein [Bifidobacterium biavatii]|uniref:Uncharacterized protein n=1 Tax=Bifidobacterium biavatii DSM 23969 TaxID=1437608 RepID=A0A086ZDU2_9BIFI|nr:hypothetical protein [Bifidobacterium biavatii]KFI44692.1 hypothetical protein BBIA_2548 [Bifidobacterium biavatii DSM 23969]